MLQAEDIKFIPVEQVETEGKFIKAICFKPKTAPIVIGLVGVALLFTKKILAIILGVFFILMALLVVFVIKDHKTLDIFEKGVEVYDGDDGVNAYFLRYDDIEKWAVKHESGHDTVEFDLGNNIKIIKDTFEADKAYRALYGIIKTKEEKYLEAEKHRQQSLSIPEAFERVKERFFKKK